MGVVCIARIREYRGNVFNHCGQIQSDDNTTFAMEWLPLFALDPPTEREAKDDPFMNPRFRIFCLKCEMRLGSAYGYCL